MKKIIPLLSVILFFACSPNDREDEEILQNQETRLFARPELQVGLIELNLEGEELTTFLSDEPRSLNVARTAFSRSTNEIITIFHTSFGSRLVKVNINSKEVTEISHSSSTEQLIVSPDGRIFTYSHNQGFILEHDYTTGSLKDTIIDLPPRDVSLISFEFNELTDELFAIGNTDGFLDPFGNGDPNLYKINVNTGEIRQIPIEFTNVYGRILSVNDIMLSKDGRLFALIDHSRFVQLDVNDASLIKVITYKDGFYGGTFSNSTNEIVGSEGEVLVRINVETGEIITKDLVRRYGNFMSSD